MKESRALYLDLAMRSKFIEPGEGVADTRAILEGMWFEKPELSEDIKLEHSLSTLTALAVDDGNSEAFIEIG